MRNPSAHTRLIAPALLALGLAAAVSAHAQTGVAARPEAAAPAGPQRNTDAPVANPNAQDPNALGEVTVQGNRREHEAMIPADKRAQWDAELKKQ
jgi:hypothetical protein